MSNNEEIFVSVNFKFKFNPQNHIGLKNADLKCISNIRNYVIEDAARLIANADSTLSCDFLNNLERQNVKIEVVIDNGVSNGNGGWNE